MINIYTKKECILINTLLDWLLFFIISLFVIYTVWYQYAKYEINNLIIIIGGVMLVVMLFKLPFKRNFHEFAPLSLLFIFIFYATVSGFIFAYRSPVFKEMLLQIFKYLIPMLAIVDFVGNRRRNLKIVLIIFSSTAIVLAISLLTKGILTKTSAITVGAYNTNALSSTLILGAFTTLLLIQEAKIKPFKLILFGGVLIEFMAQIFAASRRGVGVHALMLLVYVVIASRMKIDKNRKIKLIGLFVVLFVASYLLLDYFREMINTLVVVQRFLGTASTERGDYLRETYQAIALKLFLSNPIFGVGLGGVTREIGVYSHSLYYELLACTGILGFSLMIGFFTRLLKYFIFKSKKNLYSTKQVILENRMSMWFCLCILLSGIAVVFIYDVSLYYTFGIITAIINVNK